MFHHFTMSKYPEKSPELATPNKWQSPEPWLGQGMASSGLIISGVAINTFDNSRKLWGGQLNETPRK